MEDTEFLIVGAGPAGSALACFLGYHGFSGIMIAAAPSTSDTPRAHITNMAALECLRDIGLEDEVLKAGSTHGCMEHTRWCRSMAGEEYARIHSWGHDPQRKGDYDAASPCDPLDVPQTVLEPILVKYAKNHGFPCHFNTALVSFVQDGDKYICDVEDSVSGKTRKIRTKYLFGCDGGRSVIIRQLGIPMIKKPNQGIAINVLVEADLSHLMEHRTGNLHWVMDPEKDYPAFGKMALVRMVKPWTEWMFILFPEPGSNLTQEPTEAEYLTRVQEMIGDASIPAKIANISKWYINETVAESYSVDNIFCLGDAVHRHPPFNGLGSNTCIQDAFNLSWKIALVARGQASPSLLTTYSPERQPVGATIVARANQGFRDHTAIWDALGLTHATTPERIAAFAQLRAANAAGAQRRANLRAAVKGTEREFHAVGVEMNQRYVSDAVYLADEKSERPPLPSDPVLYREITTFPGSRVPHAWLNTRIPGKQLSTIDLAGKGRFCIFTGIGGESWRTAAQVVGQTLGVQITVVSIGWYQEYEDVYGDWARRREVSDEGCVLVRPDLFVAWRSMGVRGDAQEKLREVMGRVLGREG
ncbi:hypothetical protein T440DRAFT_509901 [Plenodomus tracheiphilus IPT5]|uniref:FAD-binding domain-containing protein n=1 Tax=Plenodomus tracheiphilus IPT5 TaxID=1408161 RepID=A0A6A7AZT3_9PLEO|nr:hypothetical protein T440DRAFT_509901 [Plenodomus tracheiphilus IPT5]